MADLRTMFGNKPTQLITKEPINEGVGATPVGSSSDSQPAVAAPPKVNAFARVAKVPVTPSQAGTGPSSAPAIPEAVGREAASHPKLGADTGLDSGVAGNNQPGDGVPTAVGEGLSGSVGGSAGSGPLAALQSLPSLAELESIDLSDLSAEPPRSTFADETPATKPTRELPPELEKQGLDFVKLIDNVYDPVILHDPSLLGSVIRNIMVELKTRPAFMKLVAPEDVRTWVRAMRDSMGLARIKKQEKKAGARGGARKSASVDHDMMADLDSLMPGID